MRTPISMTCPEHGETEFRWCEDEGGTPRVLVRSHGKCAWVVLWRDLTPDGIEFLVDMRNYETDEAGATVAWMANWWEGVALVHDVDLRPWGAPSGMPHSGTAVNAPVSAAP